MTQPGTLPSLPSPKLPKTTLVQMIQLASGVPTFWRTDPQRQAGFAAMSEKAWILMGIRAIRNIGVDELRMQFDSVNNQNSSMVFCNRGFTLGLEARSYDNTLEAYDLCERVRFRMRTAAVRSLMVPTIALQDMPATQMLPEYESEGRLILRAALDIRLLTMLAVDDLDSAEGGYIASDSDNFAQIGTLIP